LHFASARGHATVVRELLMHETLAVNAVTKHGCTALMLASLLGRPTVVTELLRHDRIDVNATTNTGDTALLLASSFGHVTAAKMCKRRRVETDEEYSSALRLQHQWRETIVLALLNNKRIDVTIKDAKACTAFAWASYHGNLVLIHSFLMHKEVDVNAAGAHGNTPLMWACLRGQSELVLDLLQHADVDVHAKNKAGSTALDIANTHELFEIAGWLVQCTKACITCKRKT
jgi:ankyrin repeat protein